MGLSMHSLQGFAQKSKHRIFFNFPSSFKETKKETFLCFTFLPTLFKITRCIQGLILWLFSHSSWIFDLGVSMTTRTKLMGLGCFLQVFEIKRLFYDKSIGHKYEFSLVSIFSIQIKKTLEKVHYINTWYSVRFD